MIYELSGFKGKSEVIGELREFEYEDGDLTILGVTLQDARNILAVLATGQVGAPLTFGGVVQEIVNTGAPGVVAPSQLGTLHRERSRLQADAPETLSSKSDDSPLAEEPQSAKLRHCRVLVAAPTKEVHTETETEQTPSVRPAARRTREKPDAPSKGEDALSDQAVRIQGIADKVAAEVMTTPAAPQAKVVEVVEVPDTQLVPPPPAPTGQPMPELDPNDLPAWLTSPKTMRVLVMGFDQHLGLRDADSIYAVCIKLKDKVPFFNTPNLRERLTSGCAMMSW